MSVRIVEMGRGVYVSDADMAGDRFYEQVYSLILIGHQRNPLNCIAMAI